MEFENCIKTTTTIIRNETHVHKYSVYNSISYAASAIHIFTREFKIKKKITEVNSTCLVYSLHAHLLQIFGYFKRFQYADVFEFFIFIFGDSFSD